MLLVAMLLEGVQVANARFVVVSDSEVPLYNAAAIYMHLMRSHRSRTGPARTYEELLKTDLVRPRSDIPVCCLFFTNGGICNATESNQPGGARGM